MKVLGVDNDALHTELTKTELRIYSTLHYKAIDLL